MAKKEFLGEKQNLAQLANDVEQWLRQQGFEAQSGDGDGKYLIQARKQSTWRSLLGNNQAINVRIDGAPEKYTIEVDAGAWMKNLAESGGAGIVAALATMYTLGIAAAWSASERAKIETDLWALKDASCPACFRVGAAVGTGEKFLRAKGITLDRSGYYKGSKIFTDTFICKFCSHTWDRGEKHRHGFLCPKCFEEKVLASTGKKIIAFKKTDQRSEQGQPVGEQVYTNTFCCNACSHAWDDGEQTMLIEVCPSCSKSDSKTGIGEYVFSQKKTSQRSPQGQFVAEQVFTRIFKCNECAHEWNDGQKVRLVEICPYCEKTGCIEFLGKQNARNGMAYTENYRCHSCTKEWHTGERTHEGLAVLAALDNLVRDTAMTQAWDADIPVDKAAIAFGCNVETMKKHYIRKDRLAEADAVFARIQEQKTNGSTAKTTANKMLTSSSEINEIIQELDTPSGNGE